MEDHNYFHTLPDTVIFNVYGQVLQNRVQGIPAQRRWFPQTNLNLIALTS